MRRSWVVGATAVLMLIAALLLVPLPDSCDQPGSLVLCYSRASAAGLTFTRNSPWPAVDAVLVLVAIAAAGAVIAARIARRQRRGRAK